MAPQLWSTINFNRPEKGARFLSPPKYLVLRRLITNSRYLRRFAVFCGILQRFPAFSGNLRQIGDDRERVCGVLRRFAALVLWGFVVFYGTLAISSFRCGTKYWGGVKSPPPFLVGSNVSDILWGKTTNW